VSPSATWRDSFVMYDSFFIHSSHWYTSLFHTYICTHTYTTRTRARTHTYTYTHHYLYIINCTLL